MAKEVTMYVGNSRKTQETKEIHVIVGKTYRVEPLNPKATKNRGRVCTVDDLLDGSGKENVLCLDMAVVKFHDTNRIAKVSVSDLVAVT